MRRVVDSDVTGVYWRDGIYSGYKSERNISFLRVMEGLKVVRVYGGIRVNTEDM